MQFYICVCADVGGKSVSVGTIQVAVVPPVKNFNDIGTTSGHKISGVEVSTESIIT